MNRTSKRFMQQVFALVIFLGTTAPGWASPIHDHCNVLPWTLTATFSASNPGAWAVAMGGTGRGGPLIQPVNPIPAAGDGTPQCPYEVSDVTSADLILTFTGPPTLTTTNIVLGGSSAAIPLDGTDPTISFTSGVMTSVLYAAHNTDGYIGGNPPTGLGVPTSLFFPMDYLIVSWNPLVANPGMNWNITEVTVTLKGNHYYRVPTPPTLMLFVLGLLAMVSCRSCWHISFSGREQGGTHKVVGCF